MKRLFVLSGKERGFTLAEVIVAVAITGFVVLATWRVITFSLHSITRQDQKIKALHISQAHLARLEAETFSRVVPETYVIHSAGTSLPSYQLNIYDPDVAASRIFVSSDDDYWYSSDGLGFSPNDDNDDGILVVGKKNGIVTVFTGTASSPPSSTEYLWTQSNLTLTFSDSEEDAGLEIQIYYRYYHLVDEGATVPSSDGEGLKERTIKLVTGVGDTDGNGTPEEKTDILGYDLTDEATLLPSSDYESFYPQARELTFRDKKGNAVWIYYVPNSDTDSSGPSGAPDGYLDPTENSIVGVVAGNFWDLDQGGPPQPPKITKTKKITVTEYWKQGGKIQDAKQEAYIVDR